jgi:hypothetical protein
MLKYELLKQFLSIVVIYLVYNMCSIILAVRNECIQGYRKKIQTWLQMLTIQLTRKHVYLSTCDPGVICRWFLWWKEGDITGLDLLRKCFMECCNFFLWEISLMKLPDSWKLSGYEHLALLERGGETTQRKCCAWPWPAKSPGSLQVLIGNSCLGILAFGAHWPGVLLS